MGDQAKNQNKNNEAATKKKKKKSDEFEFCNVCKLNHNQGRRHKYFPNHAKSLSSFLTRFQNKLSDVKFFLKNPCLLRPEHASLNRLWCVFCDSDIDEHGSFFACGNAINHLAGVDHLKNLKSFLWMYGGELDQMDSFRISEENLAKWEKKCKSLKGETVGEVSGRPLIGPSNDIHNQINSECIDSFDKHTNHFVKSNFLNGVIPLQKYTDESYQVSQSKLLEVTKVGPRRHDANSHFPVCTLFDTNAQALKDVTGYMDNKQSLVYKSGECSSDGYLNNGGMYQTYPDKRTANRESSSHGLQNLTQMSSTVEKDAEGNVHSGAPPPWFVATEEKPPNGRLIPGSGSSNLASSPTKSGKSQKLNPKRVGAAWAEKRKIELQMEKRGEIVTSNFDVDWLPNFGRVWQSGSRKESRKEFEGENKNSLKVETHSETSSKIQPYISKRMRTDTSK